MRISAILNCEGGTLKTLDCQAFAAQAKRVLQAERHCVEIQIVKGAALMETLEVQSARTDIDVVMVGGGDGTVSAAIGPCWQFGKVLAVLPAGTMNLFARSLGISLDLDVALAELAKSKETRCDIATVNDRPFVHQLAVGIHPRAIRLRDKAKTHSRYGKIWASLKALFSVIMHPPRFNVGLTAEGVERDKTKMDVMNSIGIQRLSNLSIAANPFGEGHLPYADRMDQGEMGIYCALPVSRGEAFRLMVDIALGSWLSNPQVDQFRAQRVRLHFPKVSRHTKVAVDGEMIDLTATMDVKLHPKALRVLVP